MSDFPMSQYLFGKPVEHWSSLMEVMDRNGLCDADQLAKWIDDHAAALMEEKSKNMKLEAQLLRVKNIVTKEQ